MSESFSGVTGPSAQGGAERRKGPPSHNAVFPNCAEIVSNRLAGEI